MRCFENSAPGSSPPGARQHSPRAFLFPSLCPSRPGSGPWSRMALLVVVLLVVGSCRGEGGSGDPGLEMDLAISPTPPAVGPAHLLITLQDTGSHPLEEARITVEGNMSHAGMVPVLDTAQAREPGKYVVEDFDFTMAGDWVLTVEATLPDGRQARLEHATRVVSSPPGLMEDTAGHGAAHDTMGHGSTP